MKSGFQIPDLVNFYNDQFSPLVMQLQSKKKRQNKIRFLEKYKVSLAQESPPFMSSTLCGQGCYKL